MPDQTTLQQSTVLRRHESGQRSGPSADWVALNPILGRGEIGTATDTGESRTGDGSTRWNSLPVPNSATNNGTYAPITSVKTYGAKGDGTIVTDGAITNGSAVFTSATLTASDIGKTVYVEGAGASGAALVTTIQSASTGSATLAATASTTVSGATAMWASDDTTAIQAAINAANATGMDLFFPTGVYGVFGAQQTGTVQGTGVVAAYSWTYSGQLTFPARSIAAGRKTFRLRGLIPPPRVQWGVSAEPAGTQGAILFSTATSGNVIDVIPDPGGMGYNINRSYSNIHVAMDNLTVRLPNNPQAGGVRLETASAAELFQISVDVPSKAQLTIQPTGSGYGIAMPHEGNGAMTSAVRCQVIGFPVGWLISEHSVLDNCAAQYCPIAGKVDIAAHAAVLTNFLVQDCPIGLQPIGSSAPITGTLDVQESHNSVWQDTVWVIDDAGNQLRGALCVHNSNAVSFPARGGANLNLMTPRGIGWYRNGPLVDTFQRGSMNRSYTLGTPDTSAHVWNSISGLSAMGTTSSQAYAPTTGTGAAVASLPGSTFTVVSNITTSAAWTDAGVLVHVVTNGTWWLAELKLISGTNVAQLVKFDAGAKTVVASSVSAVAASTSYDVEIRCTPYDIQMWLSGTQVGSTYTFSGAEKTKYGRINNCGIWTFRAGGGTGDDGGTRWSSIYTN